MKIAVVGAGWAGMAAAVAATQAGHHVTVFEAARSLGGRARGLQGTLPDGTTTMLDNGQHILIGAYTDTLRLMRLVGVDPDQALLRLPLALRFPDGTGLALPDWPAPWDALAGIVRARGWAWHDKFALMRTASAWQRQGFVCAPHTTVAELCAPLTQKLRDEFIDPLCVSALNTPAARASGQVFLRVLKDAMFGALGSPPGGSNLLLPRTDLGSLFPEAAARWLVRHGGTVHVGCRVQRLQALAEPPPNETPAAHEASPNRWQIDASALDGPQAYDRVILAVSASEAVKVLASGSLFAIENRATEAQDWIAATDALRFEAITTVYAWQRGARLAHPMLALRSSASAPAQFAFDRGQLGGPPGLLAFVVSASTGERDALQAAVLAQAAAQLGLQALQPVQTVVEKRATFACTPALHRPPAHIAPGLVACGDYCAGPYPATLEGAVRSGWAAGSQQDDRATAR